MNQEMDFTPFIELGQLITNDRDFRIMVDPNLDDNRFAQICTNFESLGPRETLQSFFVLVDEISKENEFDPRDQDRRDRAITLTQSLNMDQLHGLRNLMLQHFLSAIRQQSTRTEIKGSISSLLEMGESLYLDFPLHGTSQIEKEWEKIADRFDHADDQKFIKSRAHIIRKNQITEISNLYRDGYKDLAVQLLFFGYQINRFEIAALLGYEESTIFSFTKKLSLPFYPYFDATLSNFCLADVNLDTATRARRRTNKQKNDVGSIFEYEDLKSGIEAALQHGTHLHIICNQFGISRKDLQLFITEFESDRRPFGVLEERIKAELNIPELRRSKNNRAGIELLNENVDFATMIIKLDNYRFYLTETAKARILTIERFTLTRLRRKYKLPLPKPQRSTDE